MDRNLENRLMAFMNQDRVSHFYAIYDIQRLRERTLTWVALANDNVCGYLMEFDRRILYMRSSEESAVALFGKTDLRDALFNIEPKHLLTVKQIYEVVEPADRVTVGDITIFLVMLVTREEFAPRFIHDVEELGKENADAVGELLGIGAEKALGFLSGLSFGAFKGDSLVSMAASPEMLDDFAIIRGVHTLPEERSKGYSTSVCSALVEKLVQQGRSVLLYVSKDNPAAIKVYRKIGFRETGHISLGFVGKRRS